MKIVGVTKTTVHDVVGLLRDVDESYVIADLCETIIDMGMNSEAVKILLEKWKYNPGVMDATVFDK